MKHPKSLNLRSVCAGILVLGMAFAVVSVACVHPDAHAGGKKKKVKKKGKGKKKTPPPPPKKKKIPKDKTPPLFTLKGHKNWINSVFITRDGKYLVTASRDRTVKVWDLKAKKETKTFKDHPTNVKTAALSPDGKHVVVTTGAWNKKKKKWEGEIRFWDLNSGKKTKSLTGHSDIIEDLAFSPDGDWIVTVSDDKTAVVWEAKTGKSVRELKGHKEKIYDVAFNKNGSQIATASADKTVKIWDAKSGKELKTLSGPKRAVTCVAFSPDGKEIAAGCLDEQVVVWDVNSGKEVRKIKTPEGIWSVAYSPNGKYLAVAGWNDTARVYDAKSGKDLFYRSGHERTVTALVFTPDNSRMITVGIDNIIQVWEVPKK